MIVQIIGWFSILMFAFCFSAAFVLDKEGSRWAEIEAVLLLICAAICFK